MGVVVSLFGDKTSAQPEDEKLDAAIERVVKFTNSLVSTRAVSDKKRFDEAVTIDDIEFMRENIERTARAMVRIEEIRKSLSSRYRSDAEVEQGSMRFVAMSEIIDQILSTQPDVKEDTAPRLAKLVAGFDERIERVRLATRA